MDAAYEFQGVRFVWNMAKARHNMTKHGVSFETAATVFFDPFIRIEDANGPPRGRNEEARDAAIGFDDNGRMLYVVHIELGTVRRADEAIRIISARKATREERQRYDS